MYVDGRREVRFSYQKCGFASTKRAGKREKVLKSVKNVYKNLKKESFFVKKVQEKRLFARKSYKYMRK